MNFRLNKFVLLFISLFTFTGSLAAQATGSIRGSIVDASAKGGVAAARVVLIGAHLEDLSHADGTFHFDRVPAGRHNLRIERLGYATVMREVVVRAGEVTILKIDVVASAIEVAPLLVTGTLTRRRADEMLSSSAVMHGQQLDRNANATVAAMIESQPGVAVSSLGPATARPIIRGLGGDRILMLEDGQRPGDMSSLSGDHAVAIEPLTASQIEIVRGPMSLLYGSSAMGGVVNVIKHDIPESTPEHPYGQFSLELASVQPGVAGGGSLVTPLGPVVARFEGSGRLAGDLHTPAGTLENTDLNTYNAGVGMGRGGEWGHAGVAYRFYANQYGIPGEGNHEEENHEEGDHEEDDHDEHAHEGVTIEMRRHALRAETELHRDQSVMPSIKLSILGTHYQHTELENSGEVGTRFEQRIASAEASTRIQPHDSEVSAAFGVRGQYRDIQTGGSLSTPSTRDVTLAGYAISEFGNGPTHFQAGVRYDWAHYAPQEESFIFIGGQLVPTRSRSFGSFSGSIGVLHELTVATRVGLNLSRAYRTPDFNELYSNGPHLAANSYDVGDPDIDQETGIGGDLFIRHNGERVRLDGAVFIMLLDNYIFPSSRGRVELGTAGERPRFQYTNEDARFAGAEAAITIELAPKWTAEGSASYVAATFTSMREPIPIINPTDTSFVTASEHPPLIPPLNGRAALRYHAQQRSAGVEVKWAGDATRVGDFEMPTGGYAVVNIDAGVQLLLGGRLHSITARVDNLLDREYRNHLSRIKELMPQPGRNFALLYRVTI